MLALTNYTNAEINAVSAKVQPEDNAVTLYVSFKDGSGAGIRLSEDTWIDAFKAVTNAMELEQEAAVNILRELQQEMESSNGSQED